MTHSQENIKSVTANLDYLELILREKSGKVDRVLSLSFIFKLKKLHSSQIKQMIKQKNFVGRQCQNFVDSHQRRPGKTPFFVTKLKTFESISTFDTSCGKYFGPRPLPSWCLRQ